MIALTSSVNDLQLPVTDYWLTKFALEVLTSDLSEEELSLLFEDQQFSPSLEEYLFECMDDCPEDKSYVELVKEIVKV